MRDGDHENLRRLLDWRIDAIERIVRLEEDFRDMRQAQERRNSTWVVAAQVGIAVCAIVALVLPFFGIH